MQIGAALPQPKKDWTVLVWAASDNNLYPYEINDLDKFERVGPGPDLNLVATIDHRPNPDPQGPHSVQRLELQKDSLPGLHSVVRAETPDANMASPQALADFLKWGIKNYPAEHYWLVISDHGDAWQGACEDEGHQSWMSLPQIHQALHEARQDTGTRLDLLSFDCCYMGSAEVAHELKDEARYLVASQEEMGYQGLDYDRLLPQVPGSTPRQVAEGLVANSGENPEDIQTFSAVDLDKMPAVSQALNGLGQAILASPKSGAELGRIAAGSEAFWQYRDAYDLADRLGSQDPSLSQAAEQVKSAIEQAVISERHADTHPGAHGLQIEINPDSTQAGIHRGHLPGEQHPRRTRNNSYHQTAFAQDTGWEQAIARLHGSDQPAATQQSQATTSPPQAPTKSTSLSLP